MIKEKNIAVCIIFTIVTCGIYGLFWMVSITEDIDIISKNPNRRNGAMVIVFSLLTCGIYSFYWWYQNGKLLEETNQQTNIASSGNAVLFLILSLFGLGIVNYCLAQSDVNKYAAANYNN